MFVFSEKSMDIPVTAEIQESNIFFSPSKRPRMKSEIKAQIEADVKIKIEPVEEFNRNMEIIKGVPISESFSPWLKFTKIWAKSRL